MIGQPLPRTEDPDLLSGTARFLEDLEEGAGAMHLGMLRSPLAHAEVEFGDITGTSREEIVLPGDVAHLRWDHLLAGPEPIRPLAADRVRYVGQPVAAAIGRSQSEAMQALETLDVDFKPLAAVADVSVAASPDAPLVYPNMDSNVVWRDDSEASPSVFADAPVLIERVFTNGRVAPAMMECRGILAIPDGDRLIVYVGHQNPHKLHRELCKIFGLEPEKLRVIVPAVGGAFGAKASLYPDYVLCAFAAMRTGNPVKYVERRRDNLLVTAQGRSQVQRVKLAATTEGDILGLRAEIDADFGAGVDIQRWCVVLTRRMLAGAYHIPHIEWSVRGVLTHTPPIGAYRGAGRPEATYLIERGIDELAREVDMDPADVRRRNFIEANQFPYSTPTGVTYDSGDYSLAFGAALDAVDYEAIRSEQSTRSAGSLLGIGITSYVEMSAAGEEFGRVSMDESGRVTVFTGTSPSGQGHATSWGQLVAAELDIEPSKVNVLVADTEFVPKGGGTSGSRSAPLAGSAIELAVKKVAAQLKEEAASRLEASPQDVRFADGQAVVVGTDIGITFADLVSGIGASINAEEVFKSASQNFPFGTHVCVVEIDEETGETCIRRYVAVDDCGTVINPLIVEGQIEGGILQGLSYALSEGFAYDEQGQPLVSTFASYPIPSALSAVDVDVARTQTPTPVNSMGMKGVGESGITGATPAAANAIHDALSHRGIDARGLQMPYTSQKLWALLARAP